MPNELETRGFPKAQKMSGGTESFGSVSVHVSVDVFRLFQLIFGVVLRHAAESKLGDFTALDSLLQ